MVRTALVILVQTAYGFSGGAPLSSCDQDIPRHGFSPQTGDPPVEIVMDRHVMTRDTYLRVTLRSRRAFKGFLLGAESEAERWVGTWYIPYLADSSYLSECKYLHCSKRLQSAVTHSGKAASMWVTSFQWRPPEDFRGWVQFRGTVVESYQVYWANVTSNKVFVRDEEDEDISANIISDRRTSYYNHVEEETEALDNVTDFVSLFQDHPGFGDNIDEKKQIIEPVPDSILSDMQQKVCKS